MKKILHKHKKLFMIAPILACLALVICFRHVILNKSLECYFSYKCPVGGGWKISYDKISIKDSGISILGLKVSSKDGMIQAETQDFFISIKRQQLLHFDLGVRAENLSLTLAKRQTQSDFSLKEMIEAIPNFAIDIEGGELFLVDQEEKTPVYFAWVSDEKKRSLGTFYLSMTPNIQESAEVCFKLFRWPQEVIAEIEMEDVHLPWMTKVYHFFDVSSKRLIEIQKGVLNGHFWLALKEEGSVTETNAAMHLTDFLATDLGNGLEVGIDEFAFDFSYPDTKRGSEANDTWWQNIALKSQVVGGKASFKDVKTGIDFSVCDLTGHVHLSTFKDSEILLKGYLDRKGLVSPILLSGNPSHVDRDTLDFDLKLLLEPEFKQSTHLNLSIGIEEENQCIIRGKLKDMGIEQIAMFQHIIAFSFPEVKDFQLNRGKVNCELSLRLKDGKVDKLLLDNLQADNLQLYWESLDVLGFCAHLEGSAQLDFNLLPTFQFPVWDVALKNADIIIGRDKSQPISISDIQLELFMCRDVFEPSWVKAIYNGIDMHLDIVGYYKEADVKMKLQTTGDRIVSFFEAPNLTDVFQNHLIQTDLEFRRQLGYWDVTGNVKLDVEKHFEDKAEFGFYLSDKIFKYEEAPFKDLVRKSISKGNFQAESISCEFTKFINLCLKKDWFFEGLISLQGSFDSDRIDFDVETSRLAFFSEFADIKLNDLIDASQVQVSQGQFHFDINTMNLQGFIPLYHAKVQEKSLGLTFDNAKGVAYFDHNEIRLEEVKADLLGICLEGDVDFNFKDEKGLILKVDVGHLHATTKQVEKLAKTIPLLEKLTIPFEGKVMGEERSFSLKIDFREEKPLVDWDLHLKLAHGKYELTNELLIQDLTFELDIDAKEKRANVLNITGRLPSYFAEGGYAINIPYLSFSFGEEPFNCLFDARFASETMDLIRLKGEYEGSSRKVLLDKDCSEFLGNHFGVVNIAFDERGHLSNIDVSLPISLRELISFEKLLSDLGLINVDIENFLKDSYLCEGDVLIKCSFENERLLLDIVGKRLNMEGVFCEKFYLAAEKDANHLLLKSVIFDDFALQGELVKKEGGYDISSLQISGPSLNFNFGEGFLDLIEKKIHLPLSEGDFKIDPFMKVKGDIKTEGEVVVDFSKTLNDLVLKASLDLELSDFGNKGISILSSSKMNLEVSPSDGIVIKDSPFVLKVDGKEVKIDIPTLGYNFAERVCQGYRVKFSFPNETLDLLENELAALSLPIHDIPRSGEKTTSGVIDFEWTFDKFHVGGFFEKGDYLFRNQIYKIDGCSFHYDQKHLDIYVSLPMSGKKFGCNLKVQPVAPFDAIFEAYEEEFEKEISSDERERLYVECRLKGPDGFLIQKIEGNLFGFDFSFLPLSKMQDDVSMVFLGGGKIDVDKLLPHLSGKIKEFAEELSLHKGYEIKGELTLTKEDLSKSLFEGYLSGKDFDFLGYQMKTLLSQIQIRESGANLSNLKISDDGLSVVINELKLINSENGDFLIESPLVQINDLRPSLLKKRNASYQRLKPFCIKNMIFQDVTGNLNDLTTVTGKGNLFFVNTFKQGHNLLDVPIEIISRLGLDMVLLVPIQGEMDYVLKNGKLIFTKLKNSFSENKRSYFYLWNKAESYIDFDGNMHIDIRMKQYVLFKITELFILSIQGKLEDPKFSLR